MNLEHFTFLLFAATTSLITLIIAATIEFGNSSMGYMLGTFVAIMVIPAGALAYIIFVTGDKQ